MAWWGRKAAVEQEALMATLKALADAAAAISKAAETQAMVTAAYFKQFEVPATSGPAGWVNRDEDEYLGELERQGYPRHGTQAEQLKWVMENVDGDVAPLWEARSAD